MSARIADEKHPITTERAARLYRLLTILSDGPQRREALLKKLKLNERGFYRELELLRARGISVDPADNKYHLVGDLDTALAKLPVPDLKLNVREALTLAKGPTSAHRKLQSQLNHLLGTTRNGTF
jgi:biotin operon repressor